LGQIGKTKRKEKTMDMFRADLQIPKTPRTLKNQDNLFCFSSYKYILPKNRLIGDFLCFSVARTEH